MRCLPYGQFNNDPSVIWGLGYKTEKKRKGRDRQTDAGNYCSLFSTLVEI